MKLENYFRGIIGDMQMNWNNEKPTWPDDPYDDDQAEDFK